MRSLMSVASRPAGMGGRKITSKPCKLAVGQSLQSAVSTARVAQHHLDTTCLKLCLSISELLAPRLQNLLRVVELCLHSLSIFLECSPFLLGRRRAQAFPI